MSLPVVKILDRHNDSTLWVEAGGFRAAIVCHPDAKPFNLPGPGVGVRIVIDRDENQALTAFAMFVASGVQPTDTDACFRMINAAFERLANMPPNHHAHAPRVPQNEVR